MTPIDPEDHRLALLVGLAALTEVIVGCITLGVLDERWLVVATAVWLVATEDMG